MKKTPDNKTEKKKSPQKVVNNNKVIKKTKKKRKGKKVSVGKRPPRGVVYLSNLPTGFYEEELKGYMGQFGEVTGVYVPREKFSGKFKGYAFVEFLHPEVAQVAADTMNNYLMFKHLIKTSIVPPGKQKPYMFKSKFSQRKFRMATEKAAAARNRRLTPDERSRLVFKAKRRLGTTLQKLNSLGVNYKVKVDGLTEDVTLTGLKKLDPDGPFSVEIKDAVEVFGNFLKAAKTESKNQSNKSPEKASANLNDSVKVENNATQTPASVNKSKKRKSKSPEKASANLNGSFKVENIAMKTPPSVNKSKKRKSKSPEKASANLNGSVKVENNATTTPPSVGKSKKRKSESPEKASVNLNGSVKVENDAKTPPSAGKSKKRKSKSPISVGLELVSSIPEDIKDAVKAILNEAITKKTPPSMSKSKKQKGQTPNSNKPVPSVADVTKDAVGTVKQTPTGIKPDVQKSKSLKIAAGSNISLVSSPQVTENGSVKTPQSVNKSNKRKSKSPGVAKVEIETSGTPGSVKKQENKKQTPASVKSEKKKASAKNTPVTPPIAKRTRKSLKLSDTPIMENKSILPTPKRGKGGIGIAESNTPKTLMAKSVAAGAANKGTPKSATPKNKKATPSRSKLEKSKKITPTKGPITRKKKETIV